MTKENHRVTASEIARSKAEKANAAFQAQVKAEEEQRNRRIVLSELAVGISTNELHTYKLTKRKLKKYKWNTILDKYTCSECITLAETTLTGEEILNSDRCPPIHGKDDKHPFPCRCFLTEIE